MWPRCRMSKQPLVKPTFRPRSRQRAASRRHALGRGDLGLGRGDALGDLGLDQLVGAWPWRCRPSAPRRRRPAARTRSPRSSGAPAASATPSAASAVSPAPEVSNTSGGGRRKWRTGSPRTASDMPLAARVTSTALHVAERQRPRQGRLDLGVGVGGQVGGEGELGGVGLDHVGRRHSGRRSGPWNRRSAPRPRARRPRAAASITAGGDDALAVVGDQDRAGAARRVRDGAHQLPLDVAGDRPAWSPRRPAAAAGRRRRSGS